MSNIAAIELSLNDIRTAINEERDHATNLLNNTMQQIDALIENHRISIKMLEQLKERMQADHSVHAMVLSNVIGEGTNRG